MPHPGHSEQFPQNDSGEESGPKPVDIHAKLLEGGNLIRTAQISDNSTVPKEVTDSFNLLRQGDLNGFSNYFFNNPNAQNSIKSALAAKGIDLYVDRPQTDSVSGRIALSTEVKGIEPLSRTLLIDGKNPPKADLLYPAGANYDALRSRFLQAGKKIDVGEHTREIQQRLQPLKTPARTMLG